MRNIIPIIFVAATLLAGCRSPARVNKTTTLGSNTVASTNAVVATPAPVGPDTVASASAVIDPPAPVGPNTQAKALSENVMLGNLGGAFIVILAILAALRPRPSALCLGILVVKKSAMLETMASGGVCKAHKIMWYGGSVLCLPLVLW